MTSSPAGTVSKDRIGGTLWAALLLAVTLTPLLVSGSARNSFRLPKTLFFQGAMLVIGGTVGAWLLVAPKPFAVFARHRKPLLIATAAVLWTAVVSMTAVQPELARFAPLTVGAFAILFTLTVVLGRGLVLPMLALLVPAAVNACFAVLQALHLWSPVAVHFQRHGRMHVVGLLGNPDYVGVYLIVPGIAALAAAFAFRRYRILFAFLFGVIAVGIFFAQSVSAIAALLAGLIVFGFLVRSRVMRLGVVAVIAVVVVAISSYAPTRKRAVVMLDHLRQGQFSEFTSYRLPAFAVAVDMFRERPLLGVGPGGYEAKYMSYKIANDERFPEWISVGNANFGEAHNDHLQLLAEAGLPGYGLFLLALLSVASLSFRRGTLQEAKDVYVRFFGLPSAVAFSIVALAQFPLYLTESTMAAVFAAGLAHAWAAPPLTTEDVG